MPEEKMSKLMYRGAKNLKPAMNNFFKWEGEKIVGACAEGCVLHELGAAPFSKNEFEKDPDPILDALPDEWFYRMNDNRPVVHPVIGRTYSVHGIIVDLNDNHGWRRERIAAWLRTIGW